MSNYKHSILCSISSLAISLTTLKTKTNLEMRSFPLRVIFKAIKTPNTYLRFSFMFKISEVYLQQAQFYALQFSLPPNSLAYLSRMYPMVCITLDTGSKIHQYFSGIYIIDLRNTFQCLPRSAKNYLCGCQYLLQRGQVCHQQDYSTRNTHEFTAIPGPVCNREICGVDPRCQVNPFIMITNDKIFLF